MSELAAIFDMWSAANLLTELITNLAHEFDFPKNECLNIDNLKKAIC